MSQVNYESGKRCPDAEYLQSIAECGIDVGYVVTGTRATAPDFFRLATMYLLESIGNRTGFAEDVLTFAIEALAEAALAEWMDDPEIQNAPPGRHYDMSSWVNIYRCDELIQALYENARLLRDVFGSVNAALLEDPIRISGAKKLSLVLMLFKAFKTADKVDWEVLRSAVAIAGT